VRVALRSESTSIKKFKTGWGVLPVFAIGLHGKDATLLHKIKSYFGVGRIWIVKSSGLNIYAVQALKDLEIIIAHFDKYPLITKKRADFLLFKSIVELMNSKEHLTPEGLRKILSIRASMNWGLSPELKAAFPGILPVNRPVVEFIRIPNPNWLAGFIDGEGCFYVGIFQSKTHKSGTVIQLCFSISQHSRDAKLLEYLTQYLDCGKYYPCSGRNSGVFRVTSIADIADKIIPFFDNYPLVGAKSIELSDFKKVVELMKLQAHLWKHSFHKILQIKAGMNKGRSPEVYGCVSTSTGGDAPNLSLLVIWFLAAAASSSLPHPLIIVVVVVLV